MSKCAFKPKSQHSAHLSSLTLHSCSNKAVSFHSLYQNQSVLTTQPNNFKPYQPAHKVHITIVNPRLRIVLWYLILTVTAGLFAEMAGLILAPNALNLAHTFIQLSIPGYIQFQKWICLIKADYTEPGVDKSPNLADRLLDYLEILGPRRAWLFHLC